MITPKHTETKLMHCTALLISTLTTKLYSHIWTACWVCQKFPEDILVMDIFH